MFRIRRFERGDLAEVMALVGRTLGENYDPSVYLHLANSWPEAFIVATRGRRIVGFSLGSVHEGTVARLLMLAVHPAYRRRAVGTHLLEVFLAEVKRKGMTGIVLEVRVRNKDAIMFYQHHGFSIRGLLERYYTSGDDAYTMERAIP